MAHRQLRQAGITGWQTNLRVVASGRVCYLDITFVERWVVFEVDGYEYHHSREAFENDRRRRNALVEAGWTVLQVTWRMLEDDPDEFIRLVTSVLALTSTHSSRDRWRGQAWNLHAGASGADRVA